MNNNLLMFLLTPKCLDREKATPFTFPWTFHDRTKNKECK